jgi:hypothetical protein
MSEWPPEDDGAEREKPKREAEELEDGSLDPGELTGEPAWWDEGPATTDLIWSLAGRGPTCPRFCGSRAQHADLTRDEGLLGICVHCLRPGRGD